MPSLSITTAKPRPPPVNHHRKARPPNAIGQRKSQNILTRWNHPSNKVWVPHWKSTWFVAKTIIYISTILLNLTEMLLTMSKSTTSSKIPFLICKKCFPIHIDYHVWFKTAFCHIVTVPRNYFVQTASVLSTIISTAMLNHWPLPLLKRANSFYLILLTLHQTPSTHMLLLALIYLRCLELPQIGF